jgi:hypothetical protein
MPALKVILEGDGCWPDVAPIVADPSKTGFVTEAAYLAGGMTSGAPSVMLRCEMKDGTVILAETSAKLFITAAAAVKGKCLRDGVDI